MAGELTDKADDHVCFRCETALTLLEGHEWPDERSLTFCSSCSLNEIAALRKLLIDVVEYVGMTYDRWDADKDHRVGKRLKALAGHAENYDAFTTQLHERIAEFK